MREIKEVNIKIPFTGDQIFKFLVTLGFISSAILFYNAAISLDDFGISFLSFMIGSPIFIFSSVFLNVYLVDKGIDRNPLHYLGYCFHFVLKKEVRKYEK